MYLPRVKIKESQIDGKGVFALENIPKGTIVWKYKPGYDLTYTSDEYEKMNAEEKAILVRSAYLSPWTDLWICPPPDDPAHYTNHSNSNNISVKYDESVSSEPYFIANRNILTNEEITNNYYDFDRITQETRPDWTNKDTV